MLSRFNFIGFILGFFIGSLFVVMYFISSDSGKPLIQTRTSLDTEYKSWLKGKGYKLLPVNPDEYSFGKNKSLEQYLEAGVLSHMVDVICIVFVEKLTNAYAVANTWGRKCNSLYFYGSFQDKYIGIHILPLRNSWQFLCDTIRHLWENRGNIQWVLFAPDNVYVIPENLRYVVATRDYNKPYYLGHNSFFWNQLFNSAKTSYVLSNGSIAALVSNFDSPDACENGGKYMKNEDFYLGKHLEELGIFPEDGRDEEGRERFHLFTPAQLMSPGGLNVLRKYSTRSLHPVVQGKECCSSTSISFQGTQEDLIYLYSYLLYNVKIFVSGNKGNRPRNETESGEVWQNFIREEMGDVDMSSIDEETYYKIWSIKADHPEEFNRRIREEALGIRKNKIGI